MRKMTLLLASAAAIISSPAVAKNNAVYVGASFGAMKAGDSEVDFNGVEDAIIIDYEFDLPSNAGWDGDLFLGYDFGPFRLEGEASKKSAEIEEYTNNVVFGGALGGPVPVGTRRAAGDTEITSFMLNGLVDFGDDEGISGFIGGGVGYAKVDLDGFSAFANTPLILDDSDGGFAWQLLAGVRQAVSDNVDVHVKYRFFNANGVDLDDGVNNGQLDFSSHSLLGGISINFGGDEPEPIPVPPPPPPRVVTPPPPPPTPAPQPQTKVCPNGQTVPIAAACPAPPAPPVPPTGERG